MINRREIKRGEEKMNRLKAVKDEIKMNEMK